MAEIIKRSTSNERNDPTIERVLFRIPAGWIEPAVSVYTEQDTEEQKYRGGCCVG